MSEKQLRTRILMKHDTEAHWNQAENFIPKAGEVIIYDADVMHDKPRMKVGNGTTKVSSLPFMGNEGGGEELKISTGLKYNKANELQVAYGDFLDGPFTNIPIFDPTLEDQDNNTFIYFDSPYSYADNFNNERHDVKFYNKTKDYDIELDTRIQLDATDIESLKAAVAAMGGQIDIDEGFYYQINCNQTPTELVSNLMLTGSLGIVPLDDTKFAGLIIFSAATKSEPFAIKWTLQTLINESIEDNLLQFESEEGYILRLPPMAIEPGLITDHEDKFVNGGTVYNFVSQSTVPTNRTIAGISLGNNILAEELKTALSIINPIQSNWLEEDSTSLAFIQNKPDVATKDFVNSSIATNTAYFKGTFNVTELDLTESATHEQIIAKLPSKISNPTNNDYTFIYFVDTTTQEVLRYERYKYNSTSTSWGYEYTLNNSSFTAAQWSAINSGITSSLVAKIGSNESAISSLNTSVSSLQSSKQNVITSSAPLSASLVSQDASHRFVTDTEKSTWNGKANSDDVILKDSDAQQTIGLTSGTSDTPLQIKSRANACYFGFKNSSGTTIGYFGVNSNKKPVFYDGGDKELAIQNQCNAHTVDGYHIVVTNALPSDASSHTDTIYIIT